MSRCWQWVAPTIIVILLSGSPPVEAQTPQVNGIAHVAFRVADLERERGFFRVLGFEEAFSLTEGGKPTEIFVKINDHQFIELYPSKDANSSLGLMHVCYESDSLDELNALYLSRGLKISAVVKGGAGNLITSLHDPDGNLIEFTQYLPGSRHFEDRGKHLSRTRISDEVQGITLRVSDLATASQFYTAKLGFEQIAGIAAGRLRISTDSDEWIDLEPATPGSKPQLAFRVSSAERAAAQLRHLGLKSNSTNHGVTVEDPEGNVFAFLESRSHTDSKSMRSAPRPDGR